MPLGSQFMIEKKLFHSNFRGQFAKSANHLPAGLNKNVVLFMSHKQIERNIVGHLLKRLTQLFYKGLF